MRDHFIRSLHELCIKDPRIVLITGDLGFGVFDKFKAERPHQFINAGVSEQNMTMLATGMALEGCIPFTYSIGNFPTLRCLEMIRNDAAYHNANVKIVSIGAGFSYGSLGISHHATEDLTIMRSLPDVNVLSPSGLWEAVEATKVAASSNGTFYLRLDKSFGQDEPINGEQFELGMLRSLRDGDIPVIVTGGILKEVQDAAVLLSSKGIEINILSAHTLKPLNISSLIHFVKGKKALVTVEEHTVSGGLGGLVAENLSDHGLMPSKFLRIGLNDIFSSIVGTQEFLRKSYNMDSLSIARRIENLIA
tara:strand:+ start:13952 stop:14869 length:918 start_codon:yes stop_codon:yes gene_type:complete